MEPRIYVRKKRPSKVTKNILVNTTNLLEQKKFGFRNSEQVLSIRVNTMKEGISELQFKSEKMYSDCSTKDYKGTSLLRIKQLRLFSDAENKLFFIYFL